MTTPSESKKMTIEERAKTIASLLNYRVYSETDKANFAAVVHEITQACDEARAEERKKVNDEWQNILPPQFKLEYEKGFSDCREKAARELSRWRVCDPEGPRNDQGELILDLIKALQPDLEGE